MTYNVFSGMLNPTQSINQSCFIKIQIDLTFLVPAYSGCPGKGAITRLSVACNVPVIVTLVKAML